jgi:hypothetical protein
MKTIVLLIIILLLSIGSLVLAQDIVVISSLVVTPVQGADGFWYLQCDGDCAVFYALGDISDLYQPFATDYAAVDYFGRMRAAYEGTIYVPLPPVQGG